MNNKQGWKEFLFGMALLSTLGNIILCLLTPSWLLISGIVVGCWTIKRMARYV